jgi:dienelactone hydrolase
VTSTASRAEEGTAVDQEIIDLNNDTNAARYSKEAADVAWDRTIGWFKRYLKP